MGGSLCRIVVMGLEHDTSKCVKCGTCVKYCPSQALQVNSNGALTLETGSCIACLGCMAVCEKRAIKLILDWTCEGDS